MRGGATGRLISTLGAGKLVRAVPWAAVQRPASRLIGSNTGRDLASSAAVESCPQGSARTPWWAYSVFFMGAQPLFGTSVLLGLLFHSHQPRPPPSLPPS